MTESEDILNARKKVIEEGIVKLLKNPVWNICIDIIRILLIIGIIVIIVILIKEIEAVKILGSDVCKICMNKTGALCQMPVSYGG